MRWLRPTVPHDAGDEVEAVADVEALLTAAAVEAPPSPRAEEIRAALLEDAGRDRMPVPGLAPLALVAGALLLALAVGVGAPVVGSFIETLLDRGAEPSEVIPGPSLPTPDRAGVHEIPMPTDVPIPARQVPASPPVEPPVADDAVEGAAAPPATPAPNAQSPATPAATPSPSPTPWPPAGPPGSVPTPPPTVPPPGTPGG